MKHTVSKDIGFEIELANGRLGCQDPEGPLQACQAIVGAHHRAHGSRPDMLDACLNEFDKHGFRVYDDHLHAEISSPLAPSAADLVLILRNARQHLLQLKRTAENDMGPLYVAFDNTNRHGVAWGMHLNVLVSRTAFEHWRATDWKPLRKHWVPFVVTSPALFGAGKLGAEAGARPCAFQMSQRADFVDRIVGLETIGSKSIINERDEPLADPARFARFHSIAWDTNCMEFANWLKFGTTQLVMALVEEGYPLPDLMLDVPLTTFAMCSRDMCCRIPHTLASGQTMSALEIQYRLAETVFDAACAGSSASSVPDAKLILTQWLRTLDALARNDTDLVRRLDWRARLTLIEHARKSEPDNLRSRDVADLSYGEIGGVFDLLLAKSAVDTLEKFVPLGDKRSPLTVSRERLRCLLIERFGRNVIAADWHRLLFETEEHDFWEVDLSDPHLDDHLCSTAERASSLVNCLTHPTFASIAKPVAQEPVMVPSSQGWLNSGGNSNVQRTRTR